MFVFRSGFRFLFRARERGKGLKCVCICTYSSTIGKHASRTIPFWQLIRQRQRQRHWERSCDLVTNWETLIMTMRIRDWQSKSDLDSICNTCDVLFQRMKIEIYFDICKCCDVGLLFSLFLSVSLWLKLGYCHMKRAVLCFKRLQCPMSSQRATNKLFSFNPHSNVSPAIQYVE